MCKKVRFRWSVETVWLCAAGKAFFLDFACGKKISDFGRARPIARTTTGDLNNATLMASGALTEEVFGPGRCGGERKGRDEEERGCLVRSYVVRSQRAQRRKQTGPSCEPQAATQSTPRHLQ